MFWNKKAIVPLLCLVACLAVCCVISIFTAGTVRADNEAFDLSTNTIIYEQLYEIRAPQPTDNGQIFTVALRKLGEKYTILSITPVVSSLAVKDSMVVPSFWSWNGKSKQRQFVGITYTSALFVLVKKKN